MVARTWRLSALDRKLLRDLWEMKGQALAIASVIAAGVTMFVTYLSNFDSLQRTRDAYYERQRFADVFASAVRVPERTAESIRRIPGVAALDTRVVVDVTLDVPGMAEPATGRLISIPGRAAPRLNAVYLRRGRWPDPSRPDDVLANEQFCEAHGFTPGSQLAAIINGRRRVLTIAGIALSPEYVYSIRPGEMIPDNRRFGVFWMERRALASAFDMEGGFNDVALTLARGASAEAVIVRLDRLLEPFGGRGAYPRSLQISAWTLANEFAQLRTFGFIIPLVFLSVAAFILNVALARALALQRPQIAALKALGYSNAALAWHYIKWALVIAAAGALGGVAAGGWLGSLLAGLYNQFFRFPVLDYRLSGGVAAASVALSLAAGALGAQSAVRRAVAVPPAEAMRPEAPARYRRSVVERWRLAARLAQTTRMVLRNVERHPVRSAMSIVGIAFAGAILLVGLAFIDVMDVLIDEQFSLTMRQSATVSFVRPRSAEAVYAVQRLPGVGRVEPIRVVAAPPPAGRPPPPPALARLAPPATGRWRSPGCRPAPRWRASSTGRAARLRCRPTGSCSRRCSPRGWASAPGASCGWRCSKARGRRVTSASPRLSTTAWGCRPTWPSTPCGGSCARGARSRPSPWPQTPPSSGRSTRASKRCPPSPASPSASSHSRISGTRWPRT